MARRWQTGGAALLREVWRGKVWSAMPVTVVQDTQELVALYIAPGTIWKQPRRTDGGQLRIPQDKWTLADRLWTGGGALRLSSPGAAHSVLALWSAGHERMLGWHINLEEPLRRTPLGFDYMDQLLDVIVSPDCGTWTWKDEAEFEEAQATGVISAELAREVRAEGRRAVELAMLRRPPFCDGWERWRPDSAWPVPALPSGWDLV